MSSTIPGQNGGLATVRKYGTNHMKRIGRKGGREAFNKFGSEFFSLLATIRNDNAYDTLSPSRRGRIEGRLRRIVSEG